MKMPDAGIPVNEKSKSYKIEHLPGFDVILNLDYPYPKELERIVAMLKSDPNGEYTPYYNSRIDVEGSDKAYFLKYKYFSGNNNRNLDFIRGRINHDPLAHPEEFDQGSRYALTGLLNEIILSAKIKVVIASSESQAIAKKYGFEKINFTEPIVAVTRKASKQKFLIYEYAEGDVASSEDPKIIEFAEELKKLFLSKGIVAHDLSSRQFIITKTTNEHHITLIDTEAFTLVF